MKSLAIKLIVFGLFGLLAGLFGSYLSKQRIHKLLSMRLFKPPSRIFLIIMSLIILVFIFNFVFFISYYRQPLGDDVLFQFTNGYKFYLDNNKIGIGQPITNIRSLLEFVRGVYFEHSGRIVGFVLIPLLTIFGQRVVAILTGLSFAFLIFLVVSIILGKIKDSLFHPLIMLLVFLTVFYFNPSICLLLMWTFTSIYVISAILFCGYYFMFENNFHYGSKQGSVLSVICFNLLGFAAGLSHQVYSVAFLTLVGFLSAREIILRRSSLKRIFYHTGLLLGTMVCILAPGNYVRAVNSHDSGLMARPFLTKLFAAAEMNLKMSFGSEYYSLFMILMMLLLTFFSYRYILNGRAGNLLKKNAVDIAFLIFLTFLWSLFPYIPYYGTLLFILWLMIMILKNATVYLGDKRSLLLLFENSYLGTFFVFFVVFAIIIANLGWFSFFVKTSVARSRLIARAIKTYRASVRLPLYEEKCSNRFTFFNYNNFKNKENETVYYKKYYGVEMLPEETK